MSARIEKLRTKLEHLYMFYEILIPAIEEKNYEQEYYWYARYLKPQNQKKKTK